MEDTIYLLVKVKVKTTFKNIHEAIAELQSETEYNIGSTDNVKVIDTEIMELRTKK